MPEKPPVQKPRPDQYCTPEISADQTHRIGEVIVVWSKLEAAMEDTIWMFLDVDMEDGKTITKRLSTEAKMQLLRLLGERHITNDAFARGFNETMKYIDELKDCRNFIAHGIWGTVMPEETPMAVSLKPKSDVGEVISEEFPRERMEAISGGIEKAKRYLIDLPEKLGRPRRVPPEQPPF